MKSRPTISIVIPIHDMKGGAEFLWRSIRMLTKQTFKDFEIVIVEEGKMAENTNAGIKQARGELIKILYLDDFLFDENALQDIIDNFGENDRWLVTGCTHFDGFQYYNPHMPHYNHDIQNGNNTIGSPSVLTIRNDDPLLFDEEMTWLLDCDYYKRMYEKYGEPKILNKLGVVIGTGDHQATNTIGETRKKYEEQYIKQKYS